MSERRIPVTRGRFVIVDEGDYARLGGFRWHLHPGANGSAYAARTVQRLGRKRKILMHREILGAPAGVVVDHVDSDGLNNRRSNLRLANAAGNSRNRRSAVGSTSRYLGVYWDAPRQKWRAKIKHERRSRELGRFDCEADAARAYDAAAVALHGEFARLNFPAGAVT